MKISYIFPSRQRPTKFFQTLDNIKALSADQNYEVICALDEDDPAMNNDEVKEKIAEYENVKCYYGISANKVAACNREVSKISEDTSIICLQSDDMLFFRHGFDNDIREAFETHFPDFSGVIHFPDSFAKSRTMTYTMMGVNLYKQLGYLYHPDFVSVFCDNHLTEMTKRMGKYAYIDKKILEHYHPIANLSPWDEQYKNSEAPENYQKDGETFSRHRANNFGL